MLGNFTPALGLNGVYFLSKFPRMYLHNFQNKMISSEKVLDDKLNHGLRKSGLIYEWKRKPATTPKIELMNTSENIKFDTINTIYNIDQNDDFVLAKGRAIGKMTQKGYNPTDGSHDIVDLKSINIVVYRPEEDVLIIDAFSENGNKDYIQRLLGTDYEKYYNTFMNALWYINYLNLQKNGVIFIDISSLNNDYFSYDRETDALKYDLVKHFGNSRPITYQAGGDLYYKKYLKYKIKYLSYKKK